ncbi:MAG: winged helix-turn-helix transcriptional regulator [Acidimicrobiales bacterium]|nr:winged helix-turn-helix transcriptional regulator [Acidimicrobiales bacterium]HRW37620.1 MarR family winged helix-turn-helix transcriptional regulator [Aquihabitans sp.]
MEPQVTDAPPVLALARLGAVMRRAFSVRMAEEAWAVDAGLRPGCFSVLRAVATGATAPSQRALGDQLGIDPSDLVGLLDVLEAAGYVERRRDPADRRRYAVEVTDDGRHAIEQFEGVAATVADDVFGVLAPADRQTLEDLLVRVITAHEDGAAVGGSSS